MKLILKIFIPIILLSSMGAVPGRSADKNGLPGDPLAGGLIYDNWITALDLKVPEGDQPLWEDQTANPRSGEITWRCKECHGWDYKGFEGAYGPTSVRYTGFPGLSGIIGSTQEEIIAWLDGTNNPEHDFLSISDPNALDDLAVFLRTMQIDAALLIDYRTGISLGDEEAGRALYLQSCSDCHGNSGDEINFSSSARPLFVGDFAAVDPWRTVHKIRFGTITGDMPAAEASGWSLSEIADVLAYSQNLTRGNLNYSITHKVSDETSIDRQGEIEPIIWAAAIIVIIILGGILWDFIENKQKSS